MSDNPLEPLAEALAALTARVEALERPEPDAVRPGASTAATGSGSGFDDGRWWLLDALAGREGTAFERAGVSGSIAYGGIATAPGAGTVRRQIEQPVPDVFDSDLESAATVLGALGHPMRLQIVRRLLLGARTLADLQQIAGAGTTGQLQHHLRELRRAGLVVSRRRNDYAIPSEWVVPVLVLVAASLGRDLRPAPKS